MTVVATRMAPVTRVQKRVASAAQSVGWSNSWRATVALFAVVVVRMGELWHPLSFAKPVMTVTLIVLGMHLAWSASATWQRALANSQVRLTMVYAAIVVLLVPTSIWRGRSITIAEVMPWLVTLVLLTGLTVPSVLTVDRITRWFSTLTAITSVLWVMQGNVLEGSRITTTGSYDPNDLGGLLALTLPLAIGGVTRGPWYARAISLASAAAILSTLLQTGSRGAFLAMIAGLLIHVCSMRPSRLIGAVIVLTFVIPVVWQFAPEVMRQRASTLLALEDDYNTTSNSGRVYLWKRGMVFALQNPLTGVGPGTFEAKLGIDFSENGSRGAWHTAHNTVVQSFAELGLIGGGILMVLIGRALWIAGFFWSNKSRVYRPELLAAFGGYCVAALFLSHAYNYLLFSMIALSVVLEMVRFRVRASSLAPQPVSAGPRLGRSVLRQRMRRG